MKLGWLLLVGSWLLVAVLYWLLAANGCELGARGVGR